jgi:hypothetical protein
MSEEGWQDDLLFWQSLDHFVEVAWLPLKELLDVLHEHEDEMDPPAKAFIFGGIGQFMRVYATRRSEANTPVQAFNDAMHTVHNDRRVQAVFAGAANQMVDSAVENLKGSV